MDGERWTVNGERSRIKRSTVKFVLDSLNFFSEPVNKPQHLKKIVLDINFFASGYSLTIIT